MKPLALLFCLLLVTCGEGTPPPPPAAVEPEDSVSSFRIRNAEIRDEVLAAMTTQGIEYSVNTDGTISFDASDNEAVDAIYYDAVGRYAARN